MKKLMKKKVSLFGKKFSVFAIVMVAMIGLTSAMLVGYLSDTVTGEVKVVSPMLQEISKTNSDYGLGLISFVDIHGGESVTLWTRTTNLADAPITGKVNNIIENTGIDCDDFSKIEARTYSDGAWAPSDGYYDITGLCGNEHDNWVQIGYGPGAEPGISTEITWAARQVDTTEIVVTFKTNAVGDYKFSSQIVPVVLP